MHILFLGRLGNIKRQTVFPSSNIKQHLLSGFILDKYSHFSFRLERHYYERRGGKFHYVASVSATVSPGDGGVHYRREKRIYKTPIADFPPVDRLYSHISGRLLTKQPFFKWTILQ